MSATYFTLLTTVGEAALATATALDSPLRLTQMAVGDGNGNLPMPDSNQTRLVNERRRAPLNTLSIDPNNPNQIIAEQVLPEDVGGWWIREIGLYDEYNRLIAVGNCPPTYKPQLTEGSGRTQIIRMVLITSSTDNITLTIDPTVVLATRQYVDDVVLELKVYVEDQMVKHVADADPHTQYAPKESPTLTGTPNAPTAAQSVNNTQIATTAFVKTAITDLRTEDVNALARDQNLADLPDLSQALSNLTLASVKTAVESTNTGVYVIVTSRITEDAELDMLPAGYMGLCKNKNTGGPLPGDKWYYLHVTGKLDNPADNPKRKGGVIKLTALMDHDFETWTGIKFDDGSGNVEKYRWTRHSTYNEVTRAASTSQAGRVQLNDSISSTSTTQAATANAVRLAYNEATRSASTSQSGRVQLNNSISSTSTTQAATASAVRRAYARASWAPPVGSPIPWPSSSIPSGWLKCDGRSFSTSSYPELARAYPNGRLPDLRGEFIRGYDDGRGVDSRRQILSSQGDAIRNIEGRIGADDQTAGYLSGAFFRYGDYDYDAKSNGGYGYIAGFDASRVVPTANENRPRNIAFLYIVRAM